MGTRIVSCRPRGPDHLPPEVWCHRLPNGAEFVERYEIAFPPGDEIGPRTGRCKGPGTGVAPLPGTCISFQGLTATQLRHSTVPLAVGRLAMTEAAAITNETSVETLARLPSDALRATR